VGEALADGAVCAFPHENGVWGEGGGLREGRGKTLRAGELHTCLLDGTK
jgi:hypothetical protein